MCGYCLAAEKLVALLDESRFSEDEELEEEPEMALAIDDASELALDEELDDELLSDLRDCPASKTFRAWSVI